MFASCCCNQQRKDEVEVFEELPQTQDLSLPNLLETQVQNDPKDDSKMPAASEEPCWKTVVMDSPPNASPDTGTQDSSTTPSADMKPNLSTLLRAGKYAAANKLLQLEKAAGGCGLDEATTERIHRIGNKFNEAMRMLQAKPGDLKVSEHNKQLGLHWGLKLDGPIMQIVSVKDYDVDFLKMVALDLKRDMEGKTCDDEISQEILGTPCTHDVCWRRKAVIKGVGQKLDDVMMVNSVNALDEPLGAVCSMKYTLAESDTTDPHGTPIPAVMSGFSRTPFVMYATSFTPLALEGNKLRGVRKVECLETKLSPMLAKVLGVMPSFLLKKLIRGNQETMAKKTLEVLNSAESANLLTQDAEFFDQLRKEIVAKF
jgi:hypothetical protein